MKSHTFKAAMIVAITTLWSGGHAQEAFVSTGYRSLNVTINRDSGFFPFLGKIDETTYLDATSFPVIGVGAGYDVYGWDIDFNFRTSVLGNGNIATSETFLGNRVLSESSASLDGLSHYGFVTRATPPIQFSGPTGESPIIFYGVLKGEITDIEGVQTHFDVSYGIGARLDLIAGEYGSLTMYGEHTTGGHIIEVPIGRSTAVSSYRFATTSTDFGMVYSLPLQKNLTLSAEVGLGTTSGAGGAMLNSGAGLFPLQGASFQSTRDWAMIGLVARF